MRPPGSSWSLIFRAATLPPFIQVTSKRMSHFSGAGADDWKASLEWMISNDFMIMLLPFGVECGVLPTALLYTMSLSGWDTCSGIRGPSFFR